MRNRASKLRILLLGGALGPVCFAAAVLIGAALRPDYDHTMQVMSALGGTGSPNAMLMNVLGFFTTGCMIVGFAIALFRFAPRSFFSIIGGLLLGIFGSGIVAAGVYSCDPGCVGVGTSREAYLHIVASVIAFLSGIGACFTWAIAFRKGSEWRSLSIMSVASGVLATGLLYAFNSTAGSPSYPGIWQRLFILSLFGWCAIVGIQSFRLTGTLEKSPRSEKSGIDSVGA